ncbi:MAG: glutamine--tRNA ligase/YqeY domain fusion protein [Lentisphaeria bacterium]|nr:glutamine--tRNA ligase/YqeY domain fusion protein [Lentisphaeria bacterium]
MSENEFNLPDNFIHEIIRKDLEAGKNGGAVRTRFPPEPNGYLHIGHAKSICLNYGTARKFGGKFNLRLDDTNPVKEDTEYVESILEDAKWLGADWEDRFFHASDYFDQMYEYALQLIKMGKAYVCDLSEDEFKEYRGTLTEPGREPPGRKRTVEENLDLFERMRAGEFPDGSKVLRARIDMASPNIHMRDPAIYRIRHADHHNTGSKWCIYPLYDFAHCLEDAIEGITHSICTLEFEIHRPLYDWILNTLDTPCKPQQIEFARLNLTYTVMSKRKLLELVKTGLVNGWDDPRMPTICGMRRRGIPASAIRDFCETIGVTKFNSLTEIELLDHCVRDDLNKSARRAMAVMNPLKLVIDNYPEGQVEEVETVNNPEDPDAGTRMVPFSRTLYIERDDFMENPAKQFHRLAVGKEVRLRSAYFVTCTSIVKDENGEIVELHATYDPATKGGNAPDGRKVKGTIHWVSADHSLEAEVRLYDRLFTIPDLSAIPEDADWKSYLNPDSMKTATCRIEPGLAELPPSTHVQFERVGYFFSDPMDHSKEHPVFNRTVALKDSWAKIAKKGG